MMRNIVDNMVNKNEMGEMMEGIMEKMMKMNNNVIELVRNMEEKQRHLAEKVYDELTNSKQEKEDFKREIHELRGGRKSIKN